MRVGRGKGFTLVELLIVIAVMGILSAVAVPGYQTFLAKKRLNGAAREVMSDLMEARMQAINQNNRFRVFFLDNRRYLILDDDDNNNAISSGETTRLKNIQTNFSDVTLSRTADPIFHPRGTATLGTTVTVTNSQGTKYVIVSLTGRVRISDTAS